MQSGRLADVCGGMSIKKMKEEGCVHACVLEVRVVEVEGGVIPSWPTAGTPASEARRLAGPRHLTSAREMKNRLTGSPRSPGLLYLQK